MVILDAEIVHKKELGEQYPCLKKYLELTKYYSCACYESEDKTRILVKVKRVSSKGTFLDLYFILDTRGKCLYKNNTKPLSPDIWITYHSINNIFFEEILVVDEYCCRMIGSYGRTVWNLWTLPAGQFIKILYLKARLLKLIGNE